MSVETFRCPGCKKELDMVVVVGGAVQHGYLEGNQIVECSSVKEIISTLEIELST